MFQRSPRHTSTSTTHTPLLWIQSSKKANGALSYLFCAKRVTRNDLKFRTDYVFCIDKAIKMVEKNKWKWIIAFVFAFVFSHFILKDLNDRAKKISLICNCECPTTSAHTTHEWMNAFLARKKNKHTNRKPTSFSVPMSVPCPMPMSLSRCQCPYWMQSNISALHFWIFK